MTTRAKNINIGVNISSVNSAENDYEVTNDNSFIMSEINYIYIKIVCILHL